MLFQSSQNKGENSREFISRVELHASTCNLSGGLTREELLVLITVRDIFDSAWHEVLKKFYSKPCSLEDVKQWSAAVEASQAPIKGHMNAIRNGTAGKK